jgi:hypothetical protein
MKYFLANFVTIIALSIFWLIGFLWMVLRLPVRLLYCSIRGHEWEWLGNGFFGMFAPKKNFKCVKCGFKTGHPEECKTVKYQREE